MNKTYFTLRRKLYSALAMLLVATVLMASTTYAWLVLSTNPELTGVSTQVGANGSLEMALLNSASWGNLGLLDGGDIDESNLKAGNNLTWGNLVNLSSDYGLEKIVLSPSRLNISKNADAYEVADNLLKVPTYGEDGRVIGLDSDSVVNKVYSNDGFSEDGYGVRGIGTVAGMSVFQIGMNSARNTVNNSRAAARTQASNTLSNTGGGLANIIVQKYINNQDSFTVEDVEQIKALAEGMQDALEEIELGLRAVFAGYITTSSAAIGTEENYKAALEKINDQSVTLSTLLTKYGGVTGMVSEISTYISILSNDETSVESVIEFCDNRINNTTGATWSEISGAIQGLVKVDNMTVAGLSVSDLEELMKQGTSEVASAVTNGMTAEGGLYITVPSGSGVLSNIADFAEDYEATVKVTLSVSGLNLDNAPVVLRTKSNVDTAYLTQAATKMKKAEVASAADSDAITDFYGYAVDLAFRTNAENANLLLQTNPEQRIYDTSSNSSTLGGGSFMSFRSSEGLSATKMVKMMSGIRVVFLDESNKVQVIAALDMTLGKDVYSGVPETEIKNDGEGTGKYTEYYLNAYPNSTNPNYQNSDVITKDEYELLPEKSNVEFNDGMVSAKLYIYAFKMTLSNADHTGDADYAEGKEYYTGGITLGEKQTDGVIMSLEQDVATKLTALVYLDGSVVNNSMVAATAAQSMSGTLNLQFSTDVELIPMENRDLMNGTGESTGESTAAPSEG